MIRSLSSWWTIVACDAISIVYSRGGLSSHVMRAFVYRRRGTSSNVMRVFVYRRLETSLHDCGKGAKSQTQSVVSLWTSVASSARFLASPSAE